MESPMPMLASQELTHTVTTTVTADKQHVLNTTTLKDGDDVILRTEHEVNIPLGATYELEIEGDVNSKSIARSLNVVNNLIGKDAFSFTNTSESTDTGTAVFKASYDPELMLFSGTAPLDSTVRIILEDGSSIKTLTASDAKWSLGISENQLQYGMNNIVLVCGTEDSEIITINIERVKPVEPFLPGLEYLISSDGTSISGTVEDARGTILLQAGTDVKQLTPTEDLTWTYSFAKPLQHGQEVTITLNYDGELIEQRVARFTKNSAALNQADGRSISGTSAPLVYIDIVAAGYAVLRTMSDEQGHWTQDFDNGLENGAAVSVTINSVFFEEITYTGPSHVQYNLTVKILSSTSIKGTAQPNASVTVIAGSNSPFTENANELGAWTAELATELTDGQSVYVTSNGETVEVFYSDGSDPVGPSSLSAEIVSATVVQGTGNAGETITVTINEDFGSSKQAVVSADGEWSVNLAAAMENLDSVAVSNGLEKINLTYVIFEASITTKTQIDGIAQAESMVTSGENNAVANEDHRFKLILSEPLTPGQSVTVTNNGQDLVLTYEPKFTAYIRAAGDKLLGTSKEPSVTVTVADVDTVVTVVDGEWEHAIEPALIVGATVKVVSGEESKTLTYNGVTQFTAEYSFALAEVSGEVNAPAIIRAVFNDNSIVETAVAAGPYTLSLGRPLAEGEPLVVACIANDTVYSTVTIHG